MLDVMSSQAQQAFSTRQLQTQGMTEGMSSHRIRDDTSSSYESDSDEAEWGRRKRPTVLARATKYKLMEYTLTDLKGSHGIAWARLSMLMASASVVFGIFMPVENITSCRRSYSALAALILANQAITLVNSLRDGAIVSRPDCKGRICAEVHFLAGALPGEIAPLRVMAFLGFIVGVLSTLFGIWLMDATTWTKIYMLSSSLYVCTSALNYEVTRRDIFEAEVWEAQWHPAPGGKPDPEYNRRVASSKVELSLVNIMNAVDKSMNTLKMIFICITGFNFMLIVYTLFTLEGKKHEHKGIFFAGVVFSVGASWFLGRAANRSELDKQEEPRMRRQGSRNPVFGWAICLALFIISTALCVAGIFLMDNDLLHIAIFAVGVCVIIDSVLALSKSVHKEANIRMLIAEIEKRLGVNLLDSTMPLFAENLGNGGAYGGDYGGGYDQGHGYPPHSAMVDQDHMDPYGQHGAYGGGGAPYGGGGQPMY